MPEDDNQEMTPPPPGGSGVVPIDPTKNVLDLVRAESKYQDAMRMAETKFQDAMRDAETRRQDDLARQKEAFDRMQADLLRIQVATNATTLSERIAELERFRYESSGKGLGVTTVVGYLLAFASLAVAAAVAFIKFGAG